MSGSSRRKKPDIGALREKGDIAGLIRLLAHPEFDVQWQAADALGKMGPGAYDHIREIWYTTDTDTRIGVIEALGEIRDPRSLPYLTGVIAKDEHPEVRWAAAIALGRLGGPEVTGPLVKALSDPDKYVRHGTAIALEQVGWVPANATEKAAYLIARQEWAAVPETGDACIVPLLAVLSDRDKSIRGIATDILGSLKSQAAWKACDQVLRDPDEEVRWKGVLAFQKCGIPLMHLPRGISRRPRRGPNPYIAALLNLLFLGLGYNYLGRWWGFLLFQVFTFTNLTYAAVYGGGHDQLPFLVLFLSIPYSIPFAVHAYWMGKKMPEL